MGERPEGDSRNGEEGNSAGDSGGKKGAKSLKASNRRWLESRARGTVPSRTWCDALIKLLQSRS